MIASRLERTVEAELVRRVQALGGLCVKVVALGRRGFPDRLCIMPGGVMTLVEVKRPRGGRLSHHQRMFHAQLAALGITVALVRDTAGIERLLMFAPKIACHDNG